MGGYGSGGHNRRNITVEACCRFDCSMLRRGGFLDDVAPRLTPWGWGFADSMDEPTATIAAQWAQVGQLLAMHIILPSGAAHPQSVRISYTDCHYGQRRAWMHCPFCDRRVFKLMYYPHTVDREGRPLHILKCRQCWRAVYRQWRERGFDRVQSRCMTLAKKLTDRGGRAYPILWEMCPDKPPRMHERTYARIAAKFDQLSDAAQELFADTIKRYSQPRRRR